MTAQSRAVLILRDVVGLPARETADLLEITVAAVNSALQRARAVLRSSSRPSAAEWAPGTDAEAAEKALLERYMRATEAVDIEALKETLAEEVRFSMPPEPGVVRRPRHGRGHVGRGRLRHGGAGRCAASSRASTASRRSPATCGATARGGRSRSTCCASRDGEIAEIVTFPLEDPARYGLPEVLA